MIIKNLKTQELSIVSQDLWIDIFSKTNNHTVIETNSENFNSLELFSIYDASICKYVAKLSKQEFETYLKCDRLLSVKNPHNSLNIHLYYIDEKYANYCGEFEFYRVRYYIDF